MSYYYIIITSLFHHYHLISTLLFPIAKTGNNEHFITYYALSIFHYYIFIPIITIITHCNMLPTGHLADEAAVGQGYSHKFNLNLLGADLAYLN